MPPVSGLNFKLAIENPASPGTYRTLLGQRTTGMPRSHDEADATSKDSSGWHEGIPVIKNWSMDVEGLYIDADPPWLDLETHFTNGTQPNVRITTPAGNTYTGKATIVDMSLDGPHDDVMTYSLSLRGSGVLTKV